MFICFACTTAYMVKSRSRSAFGAWGGIGRHERRTKNAIVGVLDTASHSRMARNSHSSSTSQGISTTVPTYTSSSERSLKINKFLEDPNIPQAIKEEIKAERTDVCTPKLYAYELCDGKGYVPYNWVYNKPTLERAEVMGYPKYNELYKTVYWDSHNYHNENVFAELVTFEKWQIKECPEPSKCIENVKNIKATAQAIQDEKDARTIKIIGAIFSVIFFASYIFK